VGREYVIGVDGGNTKTDYFLFNRNGTFTDHLRDGTCSHEHIGYEGAKQKMGHCIQTLLDRNALTMADVAAGAFGLAGIDHKHQRDHLLDVIGRIGFHVYDADNDSFLGIIAGTTHGYGICSINGTGTVSGGIDPMGNRLQVGGIGELVGDDAGGVYIARRGVRAVYDSFFRCGVQTALSAPVFRMFDIYDAGELMRAIAEKDEIIHSAQMTRAVFIAASQGDAAALEILNHVGLQLAKTSAGCIRHLHFEGTVEVVLAGSVWQKAECPSLLKTYQKHMAAFLPDKTLEYSVLGVPPATGAVLWAMSLAGDDPYAGEHRAMVTQAVERAFAKP